MDARVIGCDPERPAIGAGAFQTDRGTYRISPFGLQGGIADLAVAITEPADHPARHRTASPAVALIDARSTALARIAHFERRLLARLIAAQGPGARTNVEWGKRVAVRG